MPTERADASSREKGIKLAGMLLANDRSAPSQVYELEFTPQ
jgi:hypothetical protein